MEEFPGLCLENGLVMWSEGVLSCQIGSVSRDETAVLPFQTIRSGKVKIFFSIYIFIHTHFLGGYFFFSFFFSGATKWKRREEGAERLAVESHHLLHEWQSEPGGRSRWDVVRGSAEAAAQRSPTFENPRASSWLLGHIKGHYFTPPC